MRIIIFRPNRATDVEIDLFSHKQTRHPKFLEKLNRGLYKATVSIKTPFLNPNHEYGQVFLDVVDDYSVKENSLQPEMEVIVQNHHHADNIFPNRKSHVVEHWYNSYPEDMMSDEPVFEIPTIKSVTTLKMATVWTVWANKKDDSCPALEPVFGVSYRCIDRDYLISTWYADVFNMSISGQQSKIDKILNNPLQGAGRLYIELFWLYDVLVIPVKFDFQPKLRYGNVQRAVSQFRSGVPVLLEIYGEVLEEFMEQYNYTCAFLRTNTPLPKNTKRQYWSFEEATEAMKSPELRQKCQEEGFQITKDFSPSEIAKKYLRALGYQGSFNCGSKH